VNTEAVKNGAGDHDENNLKTRPQEGKMKPRYCTTRLLPLSTLIAYGGDHDTDNPYSNRSSQQSNNQTSHHRNKYHDARSVKDDHGSEEYSDETIVDQHNYDTLNQCFLLLNR
jgi:hypothetical protein